MHEFALVQSLVEAVEARVQTERVLVVRLDVGRLSCVVPDALDFCFEICTRGTRLEGAALEIRPVDGRARCRNCGHEGGIEGPVPACERCGSVDLHVTAGQELRLAEVEVS